MKSLVKIIALLLVLSSLFLVVGCSGNNGEDPSPEATVTLVLKDDSDGADDAYVVKISDLSEGDGIIPLLTYVSETHGLAFEMSGSMISRIGHLENNAETGEWIYIYTSVIADMDVSEYKSTVEYNGQTLTSAGVGASDMHLEDGCVIYVGIIKY